MFCVTGGGFWHQRYPSVNDTGVFDGFGCLNHPCFTSTSAFVANRSECLWGITQSLVDDGSRMSVGADLSTELDFNCVTDVGSGFEIYISDINCQ